MKKISTEALLATLLAAVGLLIALVALFGLDTFISSAVQSAMPPSASQIIMSENCHLVSDENENYLGFGEWTERANEATFAKVQIPFPAQVPVFTQPPHVTVAINGYSFAGEHGMLQALVVPGSVTSTGFTLLLEKRKRDSELHWLDIQWVAIGE